MKYATRTLFILSILAIAMTTAITFADSHLPTVQGEVKKIKAKSGKLTIKHEPIPNLDMPGMSMVFRTAEGVDFSEIKKGDKVSFTVDMVDGKMVIYSIEKSE